ncbi:MAG: hypothetical protein Q4B81_04305 [Moraxella sp.]|nr:hypothetical protein [Moraxella sp.]
MIKIKTPIHATVYTKEMQRDPLDFMARLQHFCENFLELLPEKCGFSNPKTPFELNQSVLLPKDRQGAADTLYWQRSKKMRASSIFSHLSLCRSY